MAWHDMYHEKAERLVQVKHRCLAARSRAPPAVPRPESPRGRDEPGPPPPRRRARASPESTPRPASGASSLRSRSCFTFQFNQRAAARQTTHTPTIYLLN